MKSCSQLPDHRGGHQPVMQQRIQSFILRKIAIIYSNQRHKLSVTLNDDYNDCNCENAAIKNKTSYDTYNDTNKIKY